MTQGTKIEFSQAKLDALEKELTTQAETLILQIGKVHGYNYEKAEDIDKSLRGMVVAAMLFGGHSAMKGFEQKLAGLEKSLKEALEKTSEPKIVAP